MALDLFMVGLIVKDMGASLAFYQRLGVDFPPGSETKTNVQVKMSNGLLFFLDSRPQRWDPHFTRQMDSAPASSAENYSSFLEFYLETPAAVEAKFAEMIGLGYEGLRAPYDTAFGMRFAMLRDPDGNTILISGELPKPPETQTS